RRRAFPHLEEHLRPRSRAPAPGCRRSARPARAGAPARERTRTDRPLRPLPSRPRRKHVSMTHSSDPSALDENPPPRFPDRWRLHRAGIVNVWHYLDVEFVLSGGRMILRGTNGSGKSRALEMLLPFLLDADRRRMDATGAAKVDLDELMRTGASD